MMYWQSSHIAACVLKQPVPTPWWHCCLRGEEHSSACGGRGATCGLEQAAASFPLTVAVAGRGSGA